MLESGVVGDGGLDVSTLMALLVLLLVAVDVGAAVVDEVPEVVLVPLLLVDADAVLVPLLLDVLVLDVASAVTLELAVDVELSAAVLLSVLED